MTVPRLATSRYPRLPGTIVICPYGKSTFSEEQNDILCEKSNRTLCGTVDVDYALLSPMTAHSQPNCKGKGVIEYGSKGWVCRHRRFAVPTIGASFLPL